MGWGQGPCHPLAPPLITRFPALKCNKGLWKSQDYKWNFTCEKISHEITCDISHVKRFHMKLQLKFLMRNDFIWSKKVKFHMWKISHEVKSEISYVKGIHIKLQVEISHVKGFYMKLICKWNFICKRISHEVKCEISHKIMHCKTSNSSLE
jgi:hypothetical protein